MSIPIRFTVAASTLLAWDILLTFDQEVLPVLHDVILKLIEFGRLGIERVVYAKLARKDPVLNCERPVPPFSKSQSHSVTAESICGANSICF
jgi:hypothetical protein